MSLALHRRIPGLRRPFLKLDAARAKRDAARAERDTAVAERNAALTERDTAVAERNAALTERDTAVAERNAALTERDTAVAERDAAVTVLELSHEVKAPKLVPHSKWMSYLSDNFNKPNIRILELGSRNVTGGATREPFSNASYVGFDFYHGENVDVVGDAHKLSSYFDHDEKFDLVFSSAVFEHLHMPWIVAQEIQKILKVGGHVFVETHFSFSFHEGPWNFFQFSDKGLRALFNSALGFDLIDSAMSNPINGAFGQGADEYLRGKPIGELYCHSEILCRKARNATEFEWKKVETDDIVDNTRYPPPKCAATE